jgi:hypothetical protein
MAECRYNDCNSTEIVAVLDSRLRNEPGGGNPYKERCQTCNRFQTAISKEAFKTHRSQARVLPRNFDENAADPTIPMTEWDRRDELEDALARINDDDEAEEGDEPTPDGAGAGGDGEAAVATDGGHDEPENRFTCPGCDSTVSGYPETCPECGCPYRWS